MIRRLARHDTAVITVLTTVNVLLFMVSPATPVAVAVLFVSCLLGAFVAGVKVGVG